MVAKQHGGRKARNWISANLLRLASGDVLKCQPIAFPPRLATKADEAKNTNAGLGHHGIAGMVKDMFPNCLVSLVAPLSLPMAAIILGETIQL
jgi:hypothetical protein